MIVIYSRKKVQGLAGVYADPELFNGDTESGTKLVYTDDEKIRLAYEKKNVKVEPLTTPKKTSSKKD